MTFHHANPYSLSALMDYATRVDLGPLDVLGLFCVAFVCVSLWRFMVRS